MWMTYLTIPRDNAIVYSCVLYIAPTALPGYLLGLHIFADNESMKMSAHASTYSGETEVDTTLFKDDIRLCV